MSLHRPRFRRQSARSAVIGSTREARRAGRYALRRTLFRFRPVRAVYTASRYSRAVALSEQVFQILLSLASGDLHGYAIIQDVLARTNGRTRLTASTLYAALKRLLDATLIEEIDSPRGSGDPRRRHYRLTKAGERAGRQEAARLETLAALARERQWLPRRRDAR